MQNWILSPSFPSLVDDLVSETLAPKNRVDDNRREFDSSAYTA
tara:strand:- start:297 stop:425 length:129 start_codon:yes stop_codon:yes gene_type:complete